MAQVVGAVAALLVAGGGAGIAYNILFPRGIFYLAGQSNAESQAEAAGKGAQPGAADCERRIRSCQEKVERLIAEVKALESRKPADMKEAKNEPAVESPPAKPADIGMDEARRIFKDGSATWVDARSPENYRFGHVPGAVSVPSSDFEAGYARAADRLPKGSRIVVYCESANCDESEIVIEKLLKKGYGNLVHFTDGWAAWETTDLPQEKR